MTKLPKIEKPLFKLFLTSLNKDIQYSPMTLKEEKILLIAKETQDVIQITDSIKQVIKNCVVDDVDIDKMPIFDVEYLLINIISKSVNDVFEFEFKDEDTEEKIKAVINIQDISVVTYPEATNPVKIDDDHFILMKYPNVNGLLLLESISKEQDESTKALNQFNLILDCIEKIYVKDVVYDVSSLEDDDLVEFLDGMTKAQVEKMTQFFNTMPVLKYEFKYTNSNKQEKSLVIEGIRSFFTYR